MLQNENETVWKASHENEIEEKLHKKRQAIVRFKKTFNIQALLYAIKGIFDTNALA